MADVRVPAFMLSSATLMIAPAFTTDVFSLTPDEHSVGMVREVAVNVDSSQIELKNGIAQATVESRRTGVSATVSATVYEFTARNMLIASALNPAGTATMRRGILTAAAASASASLSINSDPVPGQTSSAIAAAGDIPAGSTILLQRPGAETAYVFPAVSSAAATGTAGGPYTVPIAGSAIPTGMSFPIGSRVWILTPVPIGSTSADDLFGIKIVGTLSNNDRPVTAIFPKVRIGKGFSLSFSETDYGSMPYEFSPALLAQSEVTGRLTEIGTTAPGRLYIGG